MAIPSHYRQLAKQLGITKPADQSDDAFMRWLDNLRTHKRLIHEAKELDITLRFGMTSKELRQAIHNCLLELLRQGGFKVKANVKLGERLIEIRKIEVQQRPELKITVHYWITAPWSRNDNRGRANHTDAKSMLKGKVVQMK